MCVSPTRLWAPRGQETCAQGMPPSAKWKPYTRPGLITSALIHVDLSNSIMAITGTRNVIPHNPWRGARAASPFRGQLRARHFLLYLTKSSLQLYEDGSSATFYRKPDSIIHWASERPTHLPKSPSLIAHVLSYPTVVVWTLFQARCPWVTCYSLEVAAQRGRTLTGEGRLGELFPFEMIGRM